MISHNFIYGFRMKYGMKKSDHRCYSFPLRNDLHEKKRCNYCPNVYIRVWNNSEEKVILEGQSTEARLAEQLGNGPGAVFMVAGDSIYPK